MTEAHLPEAPLVRPPSKLLLLIEGRAVYELLSTYASMRLLRKGPQGDGHPVLVLPGFIASDFSTGTLRCFLENNGFAPHRWNLGRNYGPVEGLEDRLMERLQELADRYDRKVSIVGWSLGGVYARMLANRAPELVRAVITLGSPFNNDPKANHSWRLFERLSGTRIDEVDPQTFADVRNTPPVPTTCVYSRSDGIAAWPCCIAEEGPLNENLEVHGSHCGLGCNPLVLHAIADRLSQREGHWQPFDRSGWRSYVYPDPNRDENGSTATVAPGEAT